MWVGFHTKICVQQVKTSTGLLNTDKPSTTSDGPLLAQCRLKLIPIVLRLEALCWLVFFHSLVPSFDDLRMARLMTLCYREIEQ